jgi:hypothetical protein
MKKSFYSTLFCLLCLQTAYGQLFSTSTGVASFYSKAPLEDIEASNKSLTGIINTTTNQIAIKVPIRSFKFANGLMEEHFNENYMDSEKYPSASFSGKINENIDYTKNGTYKVTATGKLNVHGVEKERTLTGTLQIVDNKVVIDAEFIIALADHQIDVPTAVFTKIAEKIQVKVHLDCLPKNATKN